MEIGDRLRDGLRACPLPVLLPSLRPQMYQLTGGWGFRYSLLTLIVLASVLLFGENQAWEELH